MDWSPSRLVLVASGAVVVVGASYAGALCLQPSAEAVQAARLTRNLPSSAALTAPELPPRVDPLVTVTDAAAPAIPVSLPPTAGSPPVHPASVAPMPTYARRTTTAAPANIVVPADPLQNVALTGVTQSETNLAWLMELNNHHTSPVAVGDSAFGLVVSAIEPESVTLKRGSKRWTLRLGEKPIPGVALAAAPAAAGQSGTANPPSGQGNGRQGNGAVDWAQRREQFQALLANAYGGGNDYRSESGGTYSPPPPSEPAPQAENEGGPQPYFPFAFFRGGNGGAAPAQSAPTSSNPQTARRRAALLHSGTPGNSSTGGAAPIPGPEPITNPQTARRSGNTNGPTFGDPSGQSTGNSTQRRRAGGSGF